MRLPITLVVALGLILSTDAAAIPKKACKNPSLSPSKHYATVGPSSSLEPSATPKLYPASKPSSSSEPSATFEPYPTIKPYPTIELYPTSPSSGNATSSKTSTPCKSSTISYSSGSASESTHGTETPSATSSAASSKITESSSTPSETSTSISIVETSSATLEPPTSSDVIESPSTISESSQVTEASSSTSEVSTSASETESSSLASSSFFSTSTEPSSPTLETSTSISETETPSITSSSISSTSIASSSTLTPSSPSCPTPLPTQVIADSSFEDGSDAWSWDGTAILAGSTGPTAVNPRTGARSFQGRGSAPQTPWTLNIRQTVSVAPGQTYNFEIWARQALPNVCTIYVNFDGEDVLLFTPASNAYSSFPASVEVAQSSSGTGDLLIQANCVRGGTTNRLWLDDVTMTLVPPKQVVVDPSFEASSSAWTFDGTGVLTSSTGPSTVNPHTGLRSFQGRGSTPQSPWTLNLRQTVSVVPGNTYSLEVFARQALPNVCIVTATFDGVGIMDFTPGTAAYASFSGPVQATGSCGELVLSANCIRGGATNRLWLDDITLTLVE